MFCIHNLKKKSAISKYHLNIKIVKTRFEILSLLTTLTCKKRLLRTRKTHFSLDGLIIFANARINVDLCILIYDFIIISTNICKKKRVRSSN